MKLNKEILTNIALNIYEEGKMLIVEQTIPDQHETEFICNKNKNILNKLKYYNKHYYNDLSHKRKKIQIVNVFGADNDMFEEFPKDLEGLEDFDEENLKES